MTKRTSLTPGLIPRKVNPSSAYCWAYCTVSMFNAAFVILYAGVGRARNASAIAIEPKVVDLVFGSEFKSGKMALYIVLSNSHVDNCFLIAFAQKWQESARYKMWRSNVDIECLVQIIPMTSVL